MAFAYSPITFPVSKPYLTLNEFKNAPTALDYSNLVVGGNQAAQDAELVNAITRGSAWIDTYCGQILSATNDVEQARTTIKSDGTIRIHPDRFPIIAVTGLKFGTTLNQWVTAADPSQGWLERQQYIYPYAQLATTMSSQGPLSFGFPGTPGREVYYQLSYVNGYANTILDAAPIAGASSILVDDATGVLPGMELMIYDGANTERVVVAQSFSPVLGQATLPLASPLVYSHIIGANVSNLPASIKQAAIVITSGFLKIRGDSSLTMSVTTHPGSQNAGSDLMAAEKQLASQMLLPFVRKR